MRRLNSEKTAKTFANSFEITMGFLKTREVDLFSLEKPQ